MNRLGFLLLALIFPLGAWSAVVSMAFGDRIPPFCFPETNSGIELEVIGEALAYRGHVLKPVYVPFARVPLAFKQRQVDAAMTDLGEDLRPLGAFYGDSAVVYDNVFITLAERNLKIRTPADLEGLTVISFQGAAKRYPQWLGPVAQAGKFFEQNNQATQVKTLDLGRYDVVLSDRSIFRYFTLQEQKAQGKSLRPVVEHVFTKVNPDDYRPVFRDQQVRDDFNAGLKQLKASGRFQAIYDRYLKE
ncbi:MAG TPA: ABC transporter substrate-binding protein [Burkholderiaceae bacterium]|nr:ABC transporter substrate-binding protein [Burkholderiaceae bacterium]